MRDMETRLRVGRMIRMYARDRKVTIAQIGQVLEVKSEPPVYERLNGKTAIAVDELVAIARLLQTPPSSLLDDPDTILQYGCIAGTAGQSVRVNAA